MYLWAVHIRRKVIRAYQDSWDHRCRLLFCCMSSSEHNRNSFADIARLLSDFFRELDVVPSDVVAGLVLLRKFQKLERTAIVRQVNWLNLLFLCLIDLITHPNRINLISFCCHKTHPHTPNHTTSLQKKNGTYEFLSGVPVTERTRFLRLNDPKDYEHFQVKATFPQQTHIYL